MPAWSLLTSGGGSGTNDWFLDQLAVAKLVLPDARLDTIVGSEFGETVTTELVDVLGTADASPTDVNGGAILLSVGDNVETDSSGRLQLTGGATHVRDLQLEPWFMAGLVKYTQPLDVPQLADTRADMVALWVDAENWVAIGILGGASGGSTARWVASVSNAIGITTALGPNLDPEEGPVWHLFQGWIKAGAVHFAIDGTEFLSTIDAANVPGFPARLSPTVRRSATGDPALVTYEKIAVFVASPTVGAP